MPDLLIELFSEEIPARMQAQAAQDLRRLITDGLVEAGLTYAHAAAFATPRNLANVFNDTSLLLILALGQMVVILTRSIDLSMASNLCFSGMAAAMLNAAHPNIPILLIILIAVFVGTLALTGCTAATEASHPTDGVWGYVAAAGDAQLEISGAASADEVVVDRVLSPGDAWLVVHLDDDGKPGMRVGLQHVDEGESLDVAVALEDVSTEKLIVAVHADKGAEGEFDFSMDDPSGSPDRPYFVDGSELAVVVDVE